MSSSSTIDTIAKLAASLGGGSRGSSRGTLRRYATGSTAPSQVDQLMRLVGSLFGSRGRARSGGSAADQRTIQDALSLLSGLLGGGESSRGSSSRGRLGTVTLPRPAGGGQGRGGRPPSTAPSPAPEPQPGGIPPSRRSGIQTPADPEAPRIGTRTYQPQGYPEEQQNFSDEFLSPSSSNVYSFQFYRRPRDTKGILYVTFKAAEINRGSVRHGAPRLKGGRQQLRGRRGSTVGSGRKNAPGSTYAYFDVPAEVFTRMKQATSKGKFVWDTLRVRGTIYGHRYRYQLVVGQLLEGVAGAAVSQYIPRRATSKGFRTRSIADTGTGRRGFISSTLAPSGTGGSGGFTTRPAPGRKRS